MTEPTDPLNRGPETIHIPTDLAAKEMLRMMIAGSVYFAFRHFRDALATQQKLAEMAALHAAGRSQHPPANDETYERYQAEDAVFFGELERVSGQGVKRMQAVHLGLTAAGEACSVFAALDALPPSPDQYAGPKKVV